MITDEQGEQRPDLLGPQELAELLGVSRQRAYELAQRRGFPAPVAELAIGRVWSRRDVERWAAERGREL